jgi:hypothetical protein
MILKFDKILVYYDGPELFISKNNLGVSHVCINIAGLEDGREIVVAPISEQTLKELYSGKIDLLSSLRLSRSDLGWGFAHFNDAHSECVVDDFNFSVLPDPFLPDEGYFFHGQDPENWIEGFAENDRSFSVSLTVEPPEAVTGHRIHTDSLARLLLTFQRIIRHAYSHAAKNTAVKLPIDGHVFDVRSLVPSSFKIVLTPREKDNLFGTYEGLPAFMIIDEILAASGDSQKIIQLLSERFGGRLSIAVKDFFEEVVEQKTGVEVAWSDPLIKQKSVRYVTAMEAINVRNCLREVEGLGIESLEVVGFLRHANENTGAWTIETDDGLKTGTSADASMLVGATIGSKYRFICTETTTKSALGTEKYRLELFEMSVI